MIGGTVLFVLLALAAAAFVLAPLWRRDAAEAERRSSALSDARELESKREMLLASLKDLEDDRATGKIDDADYAELRSRLSAEAIAAMQRLDELEEEEKRALDEARGTSPPLRHPAARSSEPSQ